VVVGEHPVFARELRRGDGHRVQGGDLSGWLKAGTTVEDRGRAAAVSGIAVSCPGAVRAKWFMPSTVAWDRASRTIGKRGCQGEGSGMVRTIPT
jgi:hypothetical protein